MKIALFGGSFDPPHLGHEAVIKKALQVLEIDKLVIMPTFINPFKSHFAADEKHRFAWVSTVWGDLEKVEICDFEIKQKRPVPSIESVLYLAKRYKPSKFYLIIGADHLNSLTKWHEFKKLSSIVEFVVAKRDEIAVPPHFRTLDTHKDISSSFIRNSLNVDEVCAGVRLKVSKFYQNLKENAVKERENEALKKRKDFDENLAKSSKNSILKGVNSAKSSKNEALNHENLDKFNKNKKSKRKNLAKSSKDETLKLRISNITQILDDKKAENIEFFDMRGGEYFVDFVILATTLSEKHASSLIDELKTRLKPKEEFLNIQSSEEWSVLDLGDIIIHLLSETYRAKYKIEDLLRELKKQN